MGGCVKHPAKIKVSDALSSPLTTEQVVSPQKVTRLVTHHLSLVNLCWFFPVTFLSFTCLDIVAYKRTCTTIFPGTVVKLVTSWIWICFDLIVISCNCFQFNTIYIGRTRRRCLRNLCIALEDRSCKMAQ